MINKFSINNFQTTTMNNTAKNFDLIERTAKLGESIIDLCKALPNDRITDLLVPQLVRSGTSIGANYCEANEAVSKRDFANKIAISKKEIKETLHWLRMIKKATNDATDNIDTIYKEVYELLLIFSKISSSLRK